MLQLTATLPIVRELYVQHGRDYEDHFGDIGDIQYSYVGVALLYDDVKAGSGFVLAKQLLALGSIALMIE